MNVDACLSRRYHVRMDDRIGRPLRPNEISVFLNKLQPETWDSAARDRRSAFGEVWEHYPSVTPHEWQRVQLANVCADLQRRAPAFTPATLRRLLEDLPAEARTLNVTVHQLGNIDKFVRAVGRVQRSGRIDEVQARTFLRAISGRSIDELCGELETLSTGGKPSRRPSAEYRPLFPKLEGKAAPPPALAANEAGFMGDLAAAALKGPLSPQTVLHLNEMVRRRTFDGLALLPLAEREVIYKAAKRHSVDIPRPSPTDEEKGPRLAHTPVQLAESDIASRRLLSEVKKRGVSEIGRRELLEILTGERQYFERTPNGERHDMREIAWKLGGFNLPHAAPNFADDSIFPTPDPDLKEQDSAPSGRRSRSRKRQVGR